MLVISKNFPSILADNEISYFSHLEGIISSIDEHAEMQITWKPTGYNFKVMPSYPKYREIIMKAVNELNNIIGIIVGYSKSIKGSGIIDFDIKNQKGYYEQQN